MTQILEHFLEIWLREVSNRRHFSLEILKLSELQPESALRLT